MSFRTKADWFYVKIGEALILGVADKFLRFNCHKLRVEPCSKHLSVERLPPAIMIVFISVFKFNCCCVWFDLSNVEEHFVDFLVGVNVRSTKIVGLSYGFLHFKTVHDCKGDISNVDRLHFGIHSLNLPVHTIKHFHLHAPLGGDSLILMQEVDNICRTNNSYIRINCLYLLFADPLGS